MSRYSEHIGGGTGFRVAVVTRPGSQFLHLEIRLKDPSTGKWKREQKSLDTTDLAVARATAHSLVAAMATRRPIGTFAKAKRGRPSHVAKPSANPHGAMTWGRLTDLYQKSTTFAQLEENTQYQYTQAFAILLDFKDPVLGLTWREMRCVLLDQEKVDAFATARMSGAYTHPRARAGTCGPATVRNYFTGFKAAASWAYRTKDADAKRLLADRVFDDIKLPVEKNPNQPLMEDAWLDILLALADKPWPHNAAGVKYFKLLLLLAEVFGNRVNALLHVQWADIDWERRRLHWNPAFDKMEVGRWSPLPDDLYDALQAHRAHPARPDDDPWVFWARIGEGPISYETALSWLVKAFPLAIGIVKPLGLGYHGLRRKWKTDRSDQPLKAVMEAGGWKSVSSALRYDQPNEADVKAVIASGRKNRTENVVTNLVTPFEKRAAKTSQPHGKKGLK